MDKFELAYNDVFTKDGFVKPCGRQKCQALIRICESLDATGTYGDAKTGFMNIEHIKELYQKTIDHH